MIQCPHCGASLSTVTKFCVHCGNPLSPAGPTTGSAGDHVAFPPPSDGSGPSGLPLAGQGSSAAAAAWGAPIASAGGERPGSSVEPSAPLPPGTASPVAMTPAPPRWELAAQTASTQPPGPATSTAAPTATPPVPWGQPDVGDVSDSVPAAPAPDGSVAIVRRPRSAGAFMPWEPPKESREEVVISRGQLLSRDRNKRPETSRDRIIAGDLPDWEPTPPGEIVVRRGTRR